ncbi:MAG: hypothetical protein Ct9H300mP19_01250 [Dehalococcoidia bacterium]|nr:MAG: hypothetical protein Ct9H300mP19_01250 [Dehalococcoidia bacterium]
MERCDHRNGQVRTSCGLLSWFAPEGFNILAAFDTNENIVGQNISGLQVRSISQLATIVKKLDIKIGIVSVPIEHAQEVIDP